MHTHSIYIGQVAFAHSLTLRTVSASNETPRLTFRRRFRRTVIRSLPQWLLRR
jgi:hypothetical protein